MTTKPDPRQNRLIAALDKPTQDRLIPKLKLVSMPLGKIVYESGVAMHHVYLPTDCVISLLYIMESGSSAEISAVGNEGLVGLSVVMGGYSTLSRAIVQSAGHAYCLKESDLKLELDRHAGLMVLIFRYTLTLIAQMAQTAVCNRHHSIKQQLCRWLLLSLDRLPSNKLIMTQELIANLLGVRREGIGEAAGKLQNLGVISYQRGHITVLDRNKMEELSCECYAVVKKETDRLLSGSFV